MTLTFTQGHLNSHVFLSTGHTSVKMCQKLMGSIDLLKLTRSAYNSREAFDVHPTSRHAVPDSYRDQLKT